MHRLISFALAATLVLGAAIAHAEQEEDANELRFTFIGNASFLVEDGEFMLVTDFPYRSGANGYMKYDYEKVKPNGIVLCLVTHGHPDHWDFSRYIKNSWSLVGPRSLTNAIRGFDTTPIESDDPIEWETIRIEPHETFHGGMEHYSFVVTWHGVRMYFSGDIESTDDLLKETDLDVAFLTPWILAALKLENKTVDAKRIVIHHHFAREMVEEYADRVVPNQGDTFVIPFNE